MVIGDAEGLSSQRNIPWIPVTYNLSNLHHNVDVNHA